MSENGDIFSKMMDFSSKDIMNSKASSSGGKTGINEDGTAVGKTNSQGSPMGTPTPPKKLKPSEEIILKLKKYGFDMTQLEPILKTNGNQLTVSCAGSGKTTTMIFKIIYDVSTGYATRLTEVNGNKIRVPEKIKVCTFLKTGALELENRMRDWNRRLGRPDVTDSISFSTLHAEFKRTLNAMGIVTNIISETENTNLLKKALKVYALRNSNNKPLTSQDIKDLMSALTYTRNRLDEKRYEKDIYQDLNIGSTIIDAILRDWKGLRIEGGYVDYEDLQEMLYQECYVRNNPEVINFIKERYNMIYIDEFQDTSQIQYKLIKVYGADCKQVLAIGDDDQTIYSWRGSCNDIILRDFIEDFEPKLNQLSVNYRCPANILNSIKPSIELNQDRFEKQLHSHREGGEVRYGLFGSYISMLNVLGDLIYKDVSNGLSVAVLCRVNSDGLMPAIIFDTLNSFQFSISGEGMTLNSYIGRAVVGICKLFTERSTQAVKNALGFLTWDSRGINEMVKTFKNNGTSIWTVPIEDLYYSCSDVAHCVSEWRTWRDSAGDIEALKRVLQYYRTRVFSKDSQFNDVMRSAIISIESLLGYYDYDSVDDFVEALEDINERLKARIGKSKGASVQIATVHEFKGKESDSVYVWNDTEEVFPHKNCNIYNQSELEEERRVHYIACTRPKKILTLLSLRDKQGRFTFEMDLSGANMLEIGLSGSLAKKKVEEDSNLEHFARQATLDGNDEEQVGNREGVVENPSPQEEPKSSYEPVPEEIPNSTPDFSDGALFSENPFWE